MRHFVLFISCLFLIACGDNDLGRTPIKKGPMPPAPDISKMKLSKAIGTKYKQLNLLCDFTATVTRPRNSGARTFNIKRSYVLWDMTKEFAENKQLSFEYDFENVKTKIALDVEVALLAAYTETVRKNNKDWIYKLKNAAAIDGEFVLEVSEDYGDGTLGGASSRNGNLSLVDRVPADVMDLKWGPSGNKNWTTQLNVACTLDAKVDGRFRSDFKISPKDKKDN